MMPKLHKISSGISLSQDGWNELVDKFNGMRDEIRRPQEELERLRLKSRRQKAAYRSLQTAYNELSRVHGDLRRHKPAIMYPGGEPILFAGENWRIGDVELGVGVKPLTPTITVPRGEKYKEGDVIATTDQGDVVVTKIRGNTLTTKQLIKVDADAVVSSPAEIRAIGVDVELGVKPPTKIDPPEARHPRFNTTTDKPYEKS